jgi:NAD(P)H-dependent FMN reductase
VAWSDGLLLATPANFGYMSGAMKDFFERIYHPCLERGLALPYALIVKGDTDVDGAVASVERITTGLRWRRVLPPVRVVGSPGTGDLAAAEELGATLAAGMAEGIF